MRTISIAYIVSNLKNVGPTNQTLNIIKNSEFKNNSIVITLFKEDKDTMIKEYLSNNIKVIQLNMNNFIYILFGRNILRKKLSEYKIDIAHSYGIKSDYLTQKSCDRTKVKHIITLRNYPPEDILTRMKKIQGMIALKIHLNVIKKSKNLICCSKSILEKITRDYLHLNASYIQNGVDTIKFYNLTKEDKLNKRNKLNIDAKSCIFISTNSFIKRKRMDELIEGFLLIPQKEKILLLLGEGPLLKDLQNKYKENKNIIFLGKKQNIVEYLQIADYYISSSESEGLPNSVIEAISCGIPVILSNIPQHKEIIQDIGKIGYLYNLGDIDDMKNKYISCDSNQYKDFINETLKLKNSCLTMKSMSKKYCEYYKKVGNSSYNE